MEGDHNTSGQEVESDQSAVLADIRKKIQLSNLQLLQLTYHDDKFNSTIENLNNCGIKAIQSEEYRQALIYFNQNQKILQYAASCGKTIDRSVIIVTLHNQACVHQKLWDLQKSANYLQAIIYNLNFYLQNAQAKKLQTREYEIKGNKEIQQLMVFTRKKQSYALYNLQFCAVNSQIKKHSLSVNSAKSAIKIMKEICRISNVLQENLLFLQNQEVLNIARDDKYKSMLRDLASLETNLELKNYEHYLKIVKKLIREKSERHDEDSKERLKEFRTFSIGKLMQITPITFEDHQSKASVTEFFSQESKITQALYLGISYFTVGTQLRFLSSQKSQQEEEADYKLSQQFLLSEVYHLFSIYLVMTFVPIQTIFLNHLLSSFNNHYLIDLQKLSEKQRRTIELTPKEINQQLLKKQSSEDELLLPPESQIKIKTPIDARLLTKQQRRSELKKASGNQDLKRQNQRSQSEKSKSQKSADKILFFRNKKINFAEIKLKKLSRKKNKMGVESKSPRSPILGGGKPNNINISKKKSKKKNELHQRKSHSMNKSKKNCIYTTRDNRDRNISSSPEMKSSKQKSKNRSKRTSKSRQNLNNPIIVLKKLVNSTHEHPDKERMMKTIHEKSKGKVKKNELTQTKQKSKSKSKIKIKKQKVTMKKVQVSRLADSYSEYLHK